MTPEEAIEELKYDLNTLGKGVPCDTSWGIAIEQAYAMAIKALKEVQQYQAIGTVEECREAVEKQKPQIPEFQHMLSDYVAKFKCPGCGHYFNYNCTDDEIFYCNDCGRALRMENEDD